MSDDDASIVSAVLASLFPAPWRGVNTCVPAGAPPGSSWRLCTEHDEDRLELCQGPWCPRGALCVLWAGRWRAACCCTSGASYQAAAPRGLARSQGLLALMAAAPQRAGSRRMLESSNCSAAGRNSYLRAGRNPMNHSYQTIRGRVKTRYLNWLGINCGLELHVWSSGRLVVPFNANCGRELWSCGCFQCQPTHALSLWALHLGASYQVSHCQRCFRYPMHQHQSNARVWWWRAWRNDPHTSASMSCPGSKAQREC